MELDELHVHDRGARQIRDRHAIAGRDRWIRRLPVNLSRASRREQRARCPRDGEPAVFL